MRKRSAEKVPPDVPASATAARWMLEARQVANALMDTAIQQAARHDKVDVKSYAFDGQQGTWRHVSTLLQPKGS